MYSWYKRTNNNGQLRLTWEEQTSLAGGTITALLFEPKAMTFFFDQVKKYDENFLTADIKLIKFIEQYASR